MSDAAPKTLVEDHGSVRILTINNVKQRNALTMDVKAVFGPALAEAERDPNVRAIVITGAGGTFSAGGDVTLFGDMTPAKGRHVVELQFVGKLFADAGKSGPYLLRNLRGFRVDKERPGGRQELYGGGIEFQTEPYELSVFSP